MTLHRTRSRRSTATLAVVLLMLAGCAGRSLNQPPPIVDWSSGAQPAVSQLSPRVAPSGAVAPIDSNPVATAQPIGNGAVEQRAIDSSLSTTSSLPPSAPSSGAVKTGPLGIKRPYSDATLAELSRPDGDGAAPVAPSPVPLAPATAPATATASGPSWSWPVAGKPAGPFDEKSKGIDILGKAGDPVLAAADGKVTFSGTGVRGYGKLVIVQHSADLLSVYAHNRANLVEEGATVTKGQKIAEMGNTEADAVKLHFEIRRDSKPVDPLQYLPAR